MHLIAGLGNPGKKYERTRHNCGYLVVDELVQRHRLGVGREERRAIVWDAQLQGQRVKLAKPITFMNRSGEALRQLVDYYDIPLEQLLVIHDDLDTDFGRLRLRAGGGHGGQNGLRNIIQHLGSQEFARLRFGIGRPPGRVPALVYVLQPLRGDDGIAARELASRASDAVELWLQAGIESAMTQFNGSAARNRRSSQCDWRAQLEIAQRAHELAPADPRPLAKMIAAQKKLGMLHAAAQGHLRLAGLYEDAGDLPLALAEKVKAVSMQPELLEVQRAIIAGYLELGRTKKALARCLILAEILQTRGDRRGALAALAAALDINPQHPKSLALYAAWQADLQQIESAP